MRRNIFWKKNIIAVFALIYVLSPVSAFCQAAAVPVLTLADGTTVSMTQAQLNALASQPGITVSATPTVTATQVAIPIPNSLGGGFLVGEPEAIASAMNSLGITTGATAAGVSGATAAAGSITAGASVSGLAAAGGLGAGTIAAGVGAAAIAAGVATSSNSNTTTPTHHSTTSHH